MRIWGGDWNDCMNRAGLGGKGESVWLSIAWIRACKMLIRIARLSGHDADADALEPVLKQMNRAVDARGWDGEWYLTAIDDEGRDIGSRENEEGKIFLIPQLWAVLADLDDKARVKTAMESANRLLEAPLGTRVSWPAYTHIDNHIGSVTQKSAGVHENGGIYLHTMAWRLAVDAMLGDAARVERDIRQMVPWDQTYAPTEGEPYMLFNSYFGLHLCHVQPEVSCSSWELASYGGRHTCPVKCSSGYIISRYFLLIL